MLRPILLRLVLITLVSCNRAPSAGLRSDRVDQPGQPAHSSEQWLLGPEPGTDLLRAAASEASLRARFGAAAVRSDSIYVGEGMSELGTVLFPGDSARQLAIVWEDTVARARPAYVYVTGRKSTWRLYPGVGIGTDLHTLETLNGRGFQLSGFAWDYSGTTDSFNGGRLDSLWQRYGVLGYAVLLRLDPDNANAPDSVTARVMGERTFSSADPSMQLLNPRVYQIVVRPR